MSVTCISLLVLESSKLAIIGALEDLIYMSLLFPLISTLLVDLLSTMDMLMYLASPKPLWA